MLITKVSVVIDGIRWDQNVKMLGWLDQNVLGCP